MAVSFREFDVRLNANASMGGLLFAIFLVPAVLIPVVSGVAFAWMGAWMILPFAGLEFVVLVLAWAFNVRREQSYERIAMRDGRVSIEVCAGSRTERVEFNAAWARLMEMGGRLDYRLALQAHGRQIEIGRHLASEGRRALASELRDKLAK